MVEGVQVVSMGLKELEHRVAPSVEGVKQKS